MFKPGYKYKLLTCDLCGKKVFFNWIIRHKQSRCKSGYKIPTDEPDREKIVYDVAMTFYKQAELEIKRG